MNEVTIIWHTEREKPINRTPCETFHKLPSGGVQLSALSLKVTFAGVGNALGCPRSDDWHMGRVIAPRRDAGASGALGGSGFGDIGDGGGELGRRGGLATELAALATDALEVRFHCHAGECRTVFAACPLQTCFVRLARNLCKAAFMPSGANKSSLWSDYSIAKPLC